MKANDTIVNTDTVIATIAADTILPKTLETVQPSETFQTIETIVQDTSPVLDVKSYRKEEIMFKNPIDTMLWEGVLILPKDTVDRFICVMVVKDFGLHGFKEPSNEYIDSLAAYLTQKGIAVFYWERFDVDNNLQRTSMISLASFVEDIDAAYHAVKKHPQINSAQIGIFAYGNSAVAANTASFKNEKIAFEILTKPLEYTGKDHILAEERDLYKNNMAPEILQKHMRIYELYVDAAFREVASNQLNARLNELVRLETRMLSPDEVCQLYLDADERTKLMEFLRTPLLQDVLDYNPDNYVVKRKMPLLIIDKNNDVSEQIANFIEQLKK